MTNKSIAFRGEGQRNTVLRWEGPVNGIVFSSTLAINATLTVKSLSLLRTGAGGVALSATWPQSDPNNHGYVSAVISDVHVRNAATANSGTGTWLPFGTNNHY